MSVPAWLRKRLPVLSVLILLSVWAACIEPAWIDITRHAVRSNTPGETVRLVQLSDLHLRSIGRTEAGVLDAVASLDPDLILLTGDIIDRRDSLLLLDAFLSRLPPARKFAVLGNWEYWGDIDLKALRETYARHDVMLLINQCAQLSLRGRNLNIAGLDDATAGRPEPDKLRHCTEAAGEPILIQHSPGYFADARPTGKPPVLNLAGHTHGGQLSLFGWAPWTPIGSGPFNRGWYETAAGRLYVSRGIGTSILPLRFASRPEVAVFELE